MDEDISEHKPTILDKTRRRIIGKPRDVKEPSIFHKLSLIPILAWIGLGADGLSSSSYGPEEAFRTLGQHTYLAIFLAIATAFTVLIISYAYSRIIEHFPHGGGGYIVSTHTHTGQIKPVLNEVQLNLNGGIATLGFVGILDIFFRAFSMGAGTYTGIEAVSK